ncbi:MAG: SDR family NAD(P)-dependent oxidoreductase [Thermoleophilia bacterium]|nr:SDR family NAD(P)-dependent oxidoreductase [Thermoleophilia bacterium]
MSSDSRPILITGGAGFIGSNLADRLAGEGHEVIVYDALSRPGVDRNLAWLKERHDERVTHILGDVRDEDELVRAAADAKAVFHMAAQVAVTTSLVDPREDFEINVKGTINLLDSVRTRGEPVPVIFASTNKVYGDLADIEFDELDGRYEPRGDAARSGIDESRPLDFHTPYGCSKGAADQYVIDYARSFGVPTAVLRMSCIYGQRQMGTEDQGWVAHFLIRALENKPITIYGDGRQVRDILDVGDAVNAYVSALDRIEQVQGRAFNLGGGPANAVSLLELIDEMRTITGRKIELGFEDWRQGDQRWFVADTSAVRQALDLPEARGWREGVARLANWLAAERGLELHRELASAAE